MTSGLFNPGLGGIAALVLAGSIAPPASAQVHQMPPVGSRIGSGFSAGCPAGQYLVGLDIFGTDWVNSLQQICRPIYSRSEVGPQSDLKVWQGLKVGTYFAMRCPGSRPVASGLKVVAEGDPIRIRTIGLYCSPADTSQPMRAGTGVPPDSLYDRHHKGERGVPNDAAGRGSYIPDCPQGTMAVGLTGRTFGLVVSALGLQCAQPSYSRRPLPGDGTIPVLKVPTHDGAGATSRGVAIPPYSVGPGGSGGAGASRTPIHDPSSGPGSAPPPFAPVTPQDPVPANPLEDGSAPFSGVQTRPPARPHRPRGNVCHVAAIAAERGTRDAAVLALRCAQFQRQIGPEPVEAGALPPGGAP